MREEHMQQPVIQSPCFGDSVTLDIIDHSRASCALRTALQQSAAQLQEPEPQGAAQRKGPRQVSASHFVDRALQSLLLLHCDLTLTDFRCVRLGLDEQKPRAWGCYRLTHTPSGEWVEVVTSHLRRGDAAEPLMLMASMAIALHGLLYRLQVDDWQSQPIEVELDNEGWDGGNIEIDVDMTERPTQPGWPPYAAVA